MKVKIFLGRKRSRGFTIVELLAVIAVIGIMTTVTFVSLNRQKADEEVRVAAEELAKHINEMRQQALTGDTESANKACGFGLDFFDDAGQKKYRTFYSKSATSCVDTYDASNTNTVKIYTWNNAKVNMEKFGGGVPTDIFFEAPFAIITGGDQKIEFSHKTVSSAQYCVEVKSTGAVSVISGACA